MPKTSTRKKRRRKSSSRRTSVLQVATTQRHTGTHAVGLPTGALLLFGGLCLLVIGYGFLLLLGWMKGLLFTENDQFLLQNIEAGSDGVIPAERYVEWAKLQKGDNLYAIDLGDVRQLVEGHPIVKRAQVKRDLPDGLSILVQERVPIARTGRVEGRMNWLIDKEGVLIMKSFQSKHLPFILGVKPDVRAGDSIQDGPAEPALRYLELLRTFPAKKRDLLDVYVISVGNPDHLDWRLRDGKQVLLPREGDFLQVLEDASRMVFESDRQDKKLTFFDLRPEGANKIGAAE